MRAAALPLVLLLALGGAGACGPRPAGRVRVGVSAPTQREERWVRDVARLREEAAARGIDLRVQISDNDAARQLAQCENLFAQRIDALILAPHDAAAASVIVDRARLLKVPVVSYDRLVRNCEPDLYVSFDNERIGEMQGEWLTRRVPKGNYVVLAGAPTDNNATLYRRGAMKFIAPLAARGDVRVVLDQPVKDWQPAEAMKLVEDALTANGNRVDAILAPNDGTAGGAVQALAAQGLAGLVPVTGQDAEQSAVKRVLAGSQSMTIYKDTRDLAVAAIAAAADFAAGRVPATNARVPNGRIEVPSLLLPARVVEKGDVERVLVGSGYFRRDELFGPPGGGH